MSMLTISQISGKNFQTNIKISNSFFLARQRRRSLFDGFFGRVCVRTEANKGKAKKGVEECECLWAILVGRKVYFVSKGGLVFDTPVFCVSLLLD